MADKCFFVPTEVEDDCEGFIDVWGIGSIVRGWINRRQMTYRHIRKRIGSFIIGHPRYGEGITLQIPLADMTKEQQEAYHRSEKLQMEAGIRCDTGYGCTRDLEWDWSLSGAYATCHRCGYKTREHVRKYHARSEKEHIDCDGFACSICHDPERHYRCMEEGY